MKSEVDAYVEFLKNFSTQDRHFIKLFRNSDVSDCLDVYFYPKDGRFDVMDGKEVSVSLKNVVYLLDMASSGGYDTDGLISQLNSMVSSKIAHSQMLLENANTTFGPEFVDSVIQGWKDFSNNLKSMVEKYTIRKSLKPVK